MIAWLRWQAACLADDFRCWRRRWHRWYYTEPGRHCLDTGQMRAIESDLAGRPWPPKSAAPALVPVRGPELPPEREADALRRAMAPRLYFSADAYWGARWRDLFIWVAQDTAAANELRAECGLPPRETRAPLTTVIYRAA